MDEELLPQTESDSAMDMGPLAPQAELSDFLGQSVEAVQLDEEERAEFVQVAKRNMEAAIAAKAGYDERVAEWRADIAMIPFEPPYKGAPSIRTPTIRGRLDAIKAQVRASLEVDPFFSASPLSEDGARAAPAYEALMEAELRRTGSRRHLLWAAEEAVDVGTGIVKLGVRRRQTADGSDDYEIIARAIPIERYYAYPLGTDELEYINHFEVFQLPRHVLEEYAEKGIYDPEAVERVTSYAGEPLPDNIRLALGITDATQPDAAIALHPLVEVWMFWKGVRYQAVMHYPSSTLLMARRDPYPTLDTAPYFPIRSIPRAGSILSESVAGLISAFQKTNDAAYNSIMTMAQMHLSPPMVIFDDLFYKELMENKWTPGGRYRASKENPYRIIESNIPNFPLELLRLSDQMAEQSTFSNMQVPGLPVPGRRTAYEVNVVATAGTAKLRAIFLNIREDLNRVGEAFWQLLAYYRVETARVLDVYTGYKKLSVAVKEISMPTVNPQTGQVEELFIPSVYRDDVRWETSGGDTQTEKQMRMQNLQLAFQFVFPILPYVQQDSRLWNWAKQMLDNLNIPIWRDLIGSPPSQTSDTAYATALQQVQAMQQAKKVDE